MLGDGVVIDAGGEKDGDLELLGGGDVDLVEADAVFGNDLETGQGFLDDSAGDAVVAAEKGVEVTGEFEHAGLGERAAFAQLLLASLDEDAEIEEAWAAEVERRIADVENGSVQVIPIAEALAQVRAALR